MSAEIETAPPPAELKSITRVQSIPVVNDTLSTIHSVLVQNTLTSWPYAQAQALSATAYSVAAPRLQTVDGYANKGLDYVEERIPYPFQTPTNTMYQDITKAPANLYSAASKTYQDRVRAPVVGLAYGAAHGADQTITPFVNVLQAAYDRLNAMSPNQSSSAQPNGTAANDETQVGRALRLASGVKDQVVVLSAEQLKQMQQQSAIVQRLTNDLYNLNALVTSSVVAVKDRSTAITQDSYARANALAESTRAEINRLSATVAALPANVQHSIQPSLQPLQHRLADLQNSLATVYKDESASTTDKASKALAVAREQFQPISEQTIKVGLDLINSVASYLRNAVNEQTPKEKPTNGHPNGNGNSVQQQ